MSIIDSILTEPNAVIMQPPEVIPPSKPDFVSNQVSDPRRYFLNINPPAKARLVMVGGGLERCQSDYVVRRDGFPFHCVEFVAEGEGTVRLGRDRFPLRSGSLFYYGPGVAHEITTDPGRPMLKYFLNFAGTDSIPLLKKSPLLSGTVLQLISTGEIHALLEMLQRNGLGNGRHQAEIMSGILEVLLLKIAESGSAAAHESDPRAHDSFLRLKRYLDEHPTTIRTLEDAARVVRINTAYACRLFQRFHHTSPYQYLMRVKMNRAADLLVNSGKLAKEVAEETGFADPYHFSRAFKSVHGLSPRQFVQHGSRSERH